MVGRKVVVLHSARRNGRVVQLRLHEFRDAAAAQVVLADGRLWRLFCEGLLARLPGGTGFDRATLHAKLSQVTAGARAGVASAATERNPEGSLARAVEDLEVQLATGDGKPTPAGRRDLEAARPGLDRVARLIETWTKRQDDGEAGPMAHDTKDKDAEALYGEGLEYYNGGAWDKARATFQQGLAQDPAHDGLHVFAGAVEELQDDLAGALAHYDAVIARRRPELERALRERPDEFKRISDRSRMVAESCADFASCEERDEEGCESCPQSPARHYSRLSDTPEFEKLFDAFTHKAGVLMRQHRYREALEVLAVIESYEYLPGTGNMVGECRLCLGDLTEAERRYCECEYEGAHYVRSLILFARGRRREAVGHLVRGLFHNAHIGRLLAGRGRPQATRWVGAALPPRLQASEFVRESGHLFKRRPEFRALLRAALDEPGLAARLAELERALERRDADRSYEMPRELFCLRLGSDEADAEYDRHAAEVLALVDTPADEAWMPRAGERLEVVLREIRVANVIVALAAQPDRTFCFKRGTAVLPDRPGLRFVIEVARAWHYRKTLLVTGSAILGSDAAAPAPVPGVHEAPPARVAHDRCGKCDAALGPGEGTYVGASTPGTPGAPLCERCANEFLAGHSGIPYRHHPFAPVTLTDCEGVAHTLHIRTHVTPGGLSVNAFEVVDGAPGGYQFQVLDPEFTADPMALLARLLERARRALARKHLEDGSLGTHFNRDRVARGYVTWDAQAEDGMPQVVIDGRPFSWTEFGRMVATFEGWQFRIHMLDRSEEA